MTLLVEINYHAPVDQALKINFSDPGLNAVMHRSGSDNWFAQIEVPTETESLTYGYEVIDDHGNTLRREDGLPHKIRFTQSQPQLKILDRWHDNPADAPLLSSAFTKAALSRSMPLYEVSQPAGEYVEFQVLAPQITPDCQLVICGNIPELGSWDIRRAPAMADIEFPLWKFRLPLQSCTREFEYKFLIRDNTTGEVVRWEQTDNRRLNLSSVNNSVIVAGLRFEEPPGAYRCTGTVIPVFSMRSNRSFGIGDFGDLSLMLKWVAETGQNVLQILPVNDTTMTGTWTDSYPYNSISSFALHPIYLNLDMLGEIEDSVTARELESARTRLNSLAEIDYEQVFHTKMRYARTVFNQSAQSLLSSRGYLDFIENNKEWLEPYVAFSVLRDIKRTSDLTAWGVYSQYNKAKVNRFLRNKKHQADFYRYLQYNLHIQLSEVRREARRRHIILKGDIPIGISRNSVDAWVNPSLYHLNSCAGAPPDAFARDGQNWGFPTYNWEEMAHDGYQWWRSRFRHMARYFDAYRIDHLLGFFRIWEIPASQRSGLLGTFYPAKPYSVNEAYNLYGFDLIPTLHARPVIHDNHGIEEYTVRDENGIFRLADFIDNQQKIHDRFTQLPDTVENHNLRERLYQIVNDRLFIEDHRQPGLYHPRIEGYDTEQFRSLSPDQQNAYRTLHEDFFYHRHNEFWRNSAMSKLPPLIHETGMLTCGEDLGMIPQCVSSVMKDLRILSLEVQRMPKTMGVETADPATYPYLSVATTSTHDMPGLRQWMINNPDVSERLLKSLGCNPSEFDIIDAPQLCEAIIRSHIGSPSLMCVLPWQDWMSIDAALRRKNPGEELINDPSNSRNYWRYRMHISLENLLEAEPLKRRIRHLTNNS